MDAGRVPVLVGPTAVGKTAVALELAAALPIEVVSADSRQVYRRLDIGTAKPTKRERARVPHHGLDLIDPGHRYSAGRFAAEATEWIAEIQARGRLPIVVGGTGLYVRALAEGLFREPPMAPDARRRVAAWVGALSVEAVVRWASRLDPGFRGGGRQRAERSIEVALLTGYPLSYWQAVARGAPAITPFYIVLTVPRPVLHRRIAVRAAEMVRRGLIEEVAAALAEGGEARGPGFDAVGIREAVDYLHGRLPREAVAESIARSTRQYAKRQETWFRHQLGNGPVWTLDASRPAAEVARTIATAWTESLSLHA